MINIMVDIEADGPVPGLYSMVSFGAVIVKPGLNETFYGKCKPISDLWVPDALKVSGHTREETMTFQDPSTEMNRFARWIALHCNADRPILWSDNNGFDAMFISYYFHAFYGSNPFGHSSQNLGSFYKGIKRNVRHNFKHLRNTRHDHNPVNDAISNAEALLKLQLMYNIQV